jgi:predicted RNA-binding protein YlxR (DUF448 family)
LSGTNASTPLRFEHLGGTPPKGLRLCCVCRALLPKSQLHRVVRPAGRQPLVVQLAGQVASPLVFGRSLYWCAQAQCSQGLLKQQGKRLRHLLKANPSVLTPAAWHSLCSTIEATMEERVPPQ